MAVSHWFRVMGKREEFGLHQTSFDEPRGEGIPRGAYGCLGGPRESRGVWINQFHGQQPMRNCHMSFWVLMSRLFPYEPA